MGLLQMSAAQDGGGLAPIQYRVAFRQAAAHRVDVEAQIPTDGKDTVRLMFPVWTPGSYLVREYARQVENIVAVDPLSGQARTIKKTDKNHWEVDSKGAQEIVVQYSLYCREMSVRTNWVESDFAFLTGAATFLTREDALTRPHRVQWDALPTWPHIATSLKKSDEKNAWVRIAKNFDELIDSPVLMGNLNEQVLTVGGVAHHLMTLGSDGLWDFATVSKDVSKIIEVEQKFWGEIPYSEYWFLNLATESGGGLEHDNSCVLMTSRWAQKQKAKYTDWLSLVSHEFFHTWNVRRLRPKALQSYNYDAEQYMQELWIAEGITSYYDELFVARAGLLTPKEHLERNSKQIASLQGLPGRTIQSLADASFDAWIKYYRPDENANNSRVSYYTKGAQVAMLLDAEIRLRTNNAKSLDDCMRLLWQRHRAAGYDNKDFAAIVKEIVGESMDAWFVDQLQTVKELDYARFLECYGLQWKPNDADKDKANGSSKTPTVFLGMDVSNQAGKTMVDKVVRDSPASQSGIQVGDEVIGLDGYRVAQETWADRLSMLHVGDRVTCIVARRGKLIETKLDVAAPPKETWTLQRVEKPTPEQDARWKAWLAIPDEPQSK